MYTRLLSLDMLSDIENLPRKYRDYAWASIARAAGRLGSDYESYLAEIRNGFLRSYVQAELPLYDYLYFEKALKSVLAELPNLRYIEKIYVLSRLAETSFLLSREEYREFLATALNYLPPLGYSGKARLSLALSRCGMFSEALRLLSGYSGGRKASILVELSLVRQFDNDLLEKTIEMIRKLRDTKRKIVLYSRLAKHPLYSETDAPKIQDLALRLPLGDTLQDTYISLLVARNLGESGLKSELKSAIEQVIRGIPPLDLLPIDFAELAVEAAYYARGFEGALDFASQSEFYSLLAAHLVDYVSQVSIEKHLQKKVE
ncbi:MAG: hypothetical protein ABWK01_09475 [Infirmifilum sp.]